MNLIKWGRDRKRELGAQLNMNDGGATADTVRRNVQPTPPPAPTPPRPQIQQPVQQPSRPTFKPFDNSLTRGLSRGFDQVNPFDNNRTWQQTAPTQSKSTFQQAGQLGGQTARSMFGATAKTANTGLAALNTGNELRKTAQASVFGSDRDYQNAVKNMDRNTNRYIAPGSGILGKGSWFKDKNEATNIGSKDLAGRIIGAGAETYLEGKSLKMGGFAGKQLVQNGIKQGLKSQVPVLAKNAVVNTLQGGVATANQGGNVKDIAKGAAIGGTLGTVADVGLGFVGAGTSKALTPAVNKVKTFVSPKPTDIMPQLKPNQVVRDTSKLTAINELRQKLTTGNNDSARSNAILPLIHRVKNENGVDLVTGSNADRLRKATQFLENNGEAIQNGVGLPGAPKPSLMDRLKAPFNEQVGGAKIGDMPGLNRLAKDTPQVGKTDTWEQYMKDKNNLQKQSLGADNTTLAKLAPQFSELSKRQDALIIKSNEIKSTTSQDVKEIAKKDYGPVRKIYRGQAEDTLDFSPGRRKLTPDYQGVGFTSDREWSKSYGKNIFEREIDTNKVMHAEDVPKETLQKLRADWRKLVDEDLDFNQQEAEVNKILKVAQSKGYDAVDLASVIPDIAPEGEVRVLNPSVLRDTKQLTDLYNQANKPSLFKPMGEVGGAKIGDIPGLNKFAKDAPNPENSPGQWEDKTIGGNVFRRWVPATPDSLPGAELNSSTARPEIPQLQGRNGQIPSQLEMPQLPQLRSPQQSQTIPGQQISEKLSSTSLKGNELAPSASSPHSSDLQTIGKDVPEQRILLENQSKLIPGQDSLVNNTTNTTKVKLNTNRLNPDGGYDALAKLDTATRETITNMPNSEIKSIAKDAGIDTKTFTGEQLKKKIAEQLNVRQDVVRLMNEADIARKSGNEELSGQLLAQASEQGRISRSQGTDLARQLQARRIIANELDTPQQRIFKLLDSAGVNPDAYINRLKGVDFTDAKAVVEAYRDLVPAKGKDWLDTVRYNSMLSSPLTHIVNAGSNAVNVGIVAPLEKTIRGIADATGGLFGKERKYAAGEGVAYASGAAENIKKAAGEFMDVMSGRDMTQNLDLKEYSTPLAVKGLAGKTYSTLSYPMKMLGASDKFFRTLAEGGETKALNLRESKGIKIKGNKQALAEAEGSYRLYQQDTNLKGQGGILQSIDSVTNSIMKLRGEHTWAKFVFPFVKTPTNILKQGVEFSPLGFANAITATDKATALTRAAVGTAIFGTAAAMVGAGDMTWGEPTNTDERNRFRSEGKQPYAIRIGDKWVGFTKLPPAVSFPLALTAGIHDAIESGKMSDSTGSLIFEGIAKYGQFLSDQSYAKNIGDTLNAFKGDPEKAVQAVSNYPQQIVPFRALTGWIARMSDNTERKIDTSKGEVNKQVQALMQQYPGLRQQTPTRDYADKAIPSNNPVLNGFSPLKITDDRGVSANDQYNDAKKAYESKDKEVKDALKKSKGDTATLPSGKVTAKIGKSYKEFDTQKEADKAVAVENFKNSKEKTKEINGEIYFKKKNGDVTSKSKTEFEYDKVATKRKLEMDRASASNNLDGYVKLASDEIDAMEKLKGQYDPETEQDKIDALTLKQENLSDKANGYLEKGYIRKASGGKKGKAIPTSLYSQAFTTPKLGKAMQSTTKVSAPRMPSFGGVKTPRVATRPRNRMNVTSTKTRIS